MILNLAVMNGDDIGHEIVPATVDIMKKAINKFDDIKIIWNDLPVGYTSLVHFGETLSDNTLKVLNQMDGWILGPIGHAAYPKSNPNAINPHPIIRKKYDLTSNIRPSRSYDELPSIHNNVDLIIVRENNEGFQPDRNMYTGSGEFMPNPDMAMSVRVITRTNSEQVAETAFKLAEQRNKKVTVVHKKSVFKLGCGLFTESCRSVAEKFPNVEYREAHVDSIAAELVMHPENFDVLVTTNMFGDILSDLASGLVGGLGMAPGLSVGPKYVMAQATHGSAPDIAGKGIANPYALIMSGMMLFQWLGTKTNSPSLLQASKDIEDAVHNTIIEKLVTPDLGGSCSTKQVAEAVMARLPSV